MGSRVCHSMRLLQWLSELYGASTLDILQYTILACTGCERSQEAAEVYPTAVHTGGILCAMTAEMQMHVGVVQVMPAHPGRMSTG